MNLAYYSPSTEIYLNGTKLTVPVSAGSYSSSYFRVTPGTYDTQFKVAGSDSLLFDIPASPYDSAGFYTLILYNNTTGGPSKAVKITDDFSQVAASNANYRFLNMCPDAPVVDLYFNTTAVQTYRSVADNVGNQVYNIFRPTAPGTFTVQAKKAGTDSVVATLNNFTLSPQTVYTIFLSGKPGSTSNPSSLISLNVVRASY